MANASGNGFERALAVFRARLSPEEDAQFQVTGIDDLRMAILSIQSHQRARKKMIHMKRIESFLEAMEQFGKVIEVFLNATNYLAFIWGPVKLLLLTASAWVETFDELLDAYQRISQNLPIFEGYQTLFQTEPQMQTVLESVWSDILEFHSKALRIFSHSMLHTFFRSLWRDFRSRFQHILDDLAKHKARVESHANLIHIRDYAADRARIFQKFERDSTHRANEKYEYVLRWINAPAAVEVHEDLVTMRNDFFKATNVQTGQWIIHDEKVKGWLDLDVPKTSTLWVHGIPGAGKSVLASVVIDEIQRRAAVDHAIFYCKDSDSERSSYTQILRALLSQLVSQTRDLIPYYYDEGIQSGEVSLKSKKLSEKLLDFALQNVHKGFVVIDGIDECPPSERKALLEHLIQLIDRCDVTFPGKVRLMVLSREEPDIKKLLSGSETLKITSRDTLQDINIYIKYQASRLESKFSELETEDIDYIRKSVLDRTDGMFLFAKLVTENLIAQPTIHDLQREINPQVFPNGLEQAYKRTVFSIQNNTREKERDLANRILSMMLSARRPLRWHEVQCAISIDPVQQKADWARRLRFHVKDVCGSLIQILGEDRIEFVHATANFYIANSGYISALSAAYSMTVLCLQYLSFECFDQHCSVTSRVASALQGDMAFQDYAVAHWCDHIIQLVETSSEQDISHIISNELSHAVDDFSNQFEQDLATSLTTTHGTIPDSIADFPCSALLGALWTHSKTVQAQKDDRADIVSLSSLGTCLTQNRQAIEEAAVPSHSGQSKVQQLDTFYGKNLFKCPRRTCYFFHEGFDSSRRREDHNDHHERPFRCPEDDCPAQIFGFTSQKELDKHQKRIHPGATNGPAKFARLKKAKIVDDGSDSLRCPLCHECFDRRYKLRRHLRAEMRWKAEAAASKTCLAPRPDSRP